MAKKPGAEAPPVPIDIGSLNASDATTAKTSDKAPPDGDKTDDEATVSPATLGLVRVFDLKVPVTDDNGKVYHKLTVFEPEQHHYADMQRAGTGVAASFVLISKLSSVPVSAIEKLRQRDHNPIKSWIEGLASPPQGKDPKPDPDAAGEQIWECTLASPIPTNGLPVSTVTVSEPTIRAGVACEKMKTEAEQTAVLIAQITGLTVPVVMRMKRRDVARIERWIAPFSTYGANLDGQTRQIEELLKMLGMSGAGG